MRSARRAFVSVVAAVVLLTAACTPPPTEVPSPASPRRAAPAALPPSPAPRPPLTGKAVFFLDSERADHEVDFAISPDEAWIAVEHSPHRLIVYAALTGKTKLRLDVPGDVLEVGFRADSRAVWVVTHLGAAAWDLDSGRPLIAVAAPSQRHVRRAAWSPEGDLLGAIDDKSDLHVLDGATGKERFSVHVPFGARIEQWSKGSGIVVLRRLETRTLVDAATGKVVADVPAAPDDWWSTISPDGRTLLMQGENGHRYRIVDGLTGKVRTERVLRGVVVYQSGNLPTLVPLSKGTPTQIVQVEWSANGKLVAVGYDPPNSRHGMYVRFMTVTIHDAATGKRVCDLRDSTVFGGIHGFSADGTQIRAVVDVNEGKQGTFDTNTCARVKDGKSDVRRWPSFHATVDTHVAHDALAAPFEVTDARTGALLWSVPVEPPPRSPGRNAGSPPKAFSISDLKAVLSGPFARGGPVLFATRCQGVDAGDGATQPGTKTAKCSDQPEGHAAAPANRALVNVVETREPVAHTRDLTWTEEGHEKRQWLLPPGASLLAPSDDGRYHVFSAPSRAWLVDISDGSVFRVDHVLVERRLRTIVSIDSGHFDGDDDALDHVRLFVPGATDGPVVLGPGPARDELRRREVQRDFFHLS